MITKFENYTEKEKIPLMEFLEEVKKADDDVLEVFDEGGDVRNIVVDYLCNDYVTSSPYDWQKSKSISYKYVD